MLTQERGLIKLFCGALCMALCLVAVVPPGASTETEKVCLCKRAEPLVAPGPTPKPIPMHAGGMPAMSLGVRGMPAEGWLEDFFRYCEAYEIPVADTEFQLITEFDDAEFPGVLFSRYRLMVGGAEVFLQMADRETVVCWVVYFDDEAMTTVQVRETLLFYYPLVMQACVYASEETVTASEVEEIVNILHPDIRSMVMLREAVSKNIRPSRAYYYLSYEPDNEFLCSIGEWQW